MLITNIAPPTDEYVRYDFPFVEISDQLFHNPVYGAGL